tara:strand:+ start:5742 stop:5945 length:204 start_codon:yes stop_codon:yes gene_type:complete
MTKQICTATIKMNTKEVLKCINALSYFLDKYVNEMTKESLEGYKKLLKDYRDIYESMLAKEDGVVHE